VHSCTRYSRRAVLSACAACWLGDWLDKTSAAKSGQGGGYTRLHGACTTTTWILQQPQALLQMSQQHTCRHISRPCLLLYSRSGFCSICRSASAFKVPPSMSSSTTNAVLQPFATVPAPKTSTMWLHVRAKERQRIAYCHLYNNCCSSAEFVLVVCRDLRLLLTFCVIVTSINYNA